VADLLGAKAFMGAVAEALDTPLNPKPRAFFNVHVVFLITLVDASPDQNMSPTL
jgi:hypothetical protein